MKVGMVALVLLGLSVGLLGLGVLAARERAPGLFFSESFEDANLLKRGWYDGSKFLIKGEAYVLWIDELAVGTKRIGPSRRRAQDRSRGSREER